MKFFRKIFGKREADKELVAVIAALSKQLQACEREAKKSRDLLEAIPRPIWTYDNDSKKITWCNDEYAKSLGITKNEVVELQKTLGVKGKNRQSRTTIVSDGKRRVMDLTFVESQNSNEKLGLALDVSREDELERRAQHHKAVYNELLESLRSAVGVYDADQRLEFYNTAFAQLWDLPEQWLNTRPSLGNIMDRLRETRRLPEQSDFASFKKSWIAMFTDLIEPYDDMFHLPDGSAFRVLVIANPMGGLMMVFEDVTSRLELESSYNTLIAVQRETLDALAEGVSVFGSDGRLRLCNPSFASLWGLSSEVLQANPHISQISEKMSARIPFGSREKGRSLIYSMAVNRDGQKGNLLCVKIGKSDKQTVHIAYSSIPLPDGGVMITFRDISDTQRIEKTLEEKAQALEAAEELKIDFLANVSYQLRTPLNTMMGFSDIIKQEYFGSLNEKQKEYTDGIISAGEDLLRLIDDILDLSTIEAGYMEIKPKDLPIKPMLESIFELTQGWAISGNAKISIECDDDVTTAWCDEQRIRQAMINLIRNSIAYTPENGQIVIGAKLSKTKAGGVDLFVKDKGAGISKKDKERIFKPFERAAEPQGGAGLGLTLVKSIMGLHKGSVKLKSAPLKGTSIVLSLPARVDKGAANV